MSDLIDRQKAIDALDRIFDQCEEIDAHLPKGDPDRTGYKMYPDYMTVWKYLHQLPSTQPEIIRCKDCKHRVYTDDGESCPDDIVCDLWESDGFTETDYCSWGERRPDAD